MIDDSLAVEDSPGFVKHLVPIGKVHLQSLAFAVLFDAVAAPPSQGSRKQSSRSANEITHLLLTLACSLRACLRKTSKIQETWSTDTMRNTTNKSQCKKMGMIKRMGIDILTCNANHNNGNATTTTTKNATRSLRRTPMKSTNMNKRRKTFEVACDVARYEERIKPSAFGTRAARLRLDLGCSNTKMLAAQNQ